MDSHELSEWLAYDQVDGVPDAYWICGKLCQTIVGSFAGKKTQVDDFIPRERPVRIVSGDSAKAIMQGVTVAQRMKADREQRLSRNG
jgi:hypothetical protein